MVYITISKQIVLDINYIETQASADTLVIPDEIKLSIIIKEIDSKGKTSTEVLEQEMKKYFLI